MILKFIEDFEKIVKHFILFALEVFQDYLDLNKILIKSDYNIVDFNLKICLKFFRRSFHFTINSNLDENPKLILNQIKKSHINSLKVHHLTYHTKYLKKNLFQEYFEWNSFVET